MHLLVGIPAYNEAATIAEVIGRVPKAIDGVDSVEVVVVDDGSADDTAKIARAHDATVIRHPQNSGVGVAFQSAVKHALATRADVLVTIDGDGQFNPEDIPKLIRPIVEGEGLVCTASRFLDPELVPTMPWVKKWGNRRVAHLVSALTGQRYADVSCGYRAYAREALLRLTVYHSFTYTHETFLDLAAKRIPIVEVPLEIRGTRAVGKSRIASSVMRYGFRTLAIMLRTYRDQRPLALCLWLAVPHWLLGTAMFAYAYYQFHTTGSWLKSFAFAGAGIGAIGLTLLFFGFMADISSRLRRNQEEILYWQRRAGGDDEARHGPRSTPTNAPES
jgi:glycosyltransferase involved in cell wall biosynthesis